MLHARITPRVCLLHSIAHLRRGLPRTRRPRVLCGLSGEAISRCAWHTSGMSTGEVQPKRENPDELPERKFGSGQMFVTPEDDPRSPGGFPDERSLLVGYLRDYRLTIELKCSGLDPAALARRSVPPSNLSLLGLLRHLAEAERFWFREALSGESPSPLYRRPDDRDAAFNDAAPDAVLVDQAWETWREEVRFAERFVDAAPSFEVTGTTRDGMVLNLREVLVHMIGEYARHAGHADLLRERIDGRVGL